MGKSKGSQRTKGNVRPSNSGHTAELLGPSGKLGFVGFSSSKVGQHVSQESENDVDGMFSMVMKKMLKRDATTKLKAVQEFKELVCEKDKETVLSVLPFWPRLYNKLSLDFDRRIREATQEANAKLVEKVKRDIAPYLKNITGVWLLSQCDIYPPAASLAKSTFFATFPEEKQSEALMFCKEQILMYFKENLFEHTPQSLSEPNVSAEEIENKYILVIAGSLHGLKLFLTSISTEEKKTLVENMKMFVSENKFWKHAKNKNSQVRAAWYNLVSTLCHDMPDVFDKFEHKLGCAILGCLSENDPAVASAIWEAALHYIVAFENCWKTIDVHKIVLPQLWGLLKKGGNGNASILFPCLLPFLSKLSQSVIKDKPQFFTDFFKSIIQSLFLADVKKSTIECNAIVVAYMECLQYVCLQHSGEKSENSFIKELICGQLLSLVEKSFTNNGAHLPVSKLYQSLGIFLQTLELDVSKDSNCMDFQQLMWHFWEKMYNVCDNLLDRKHLVQHADLVFLAYFIHCVHEPLNNLMKKRKLKVRFAEENAEEAEEETSAMDAATVTVSNTTRIPVFKFTVKIGKLLCSILKNKFEAHYMKLLCETLTAARCPELFQEILQQLDVSTEVVKDAPLLFFEHTVLTWIQQKHLDATMVANLVDIIFIICSCVEKETAVKVLNTCCTVENPLFLNGLLQRGLNMLDEDKVFCKWLKSDEASRSVIRLLQLVADGLVSNSRNSPMSLNSNAFCSTLKTFFECSTSRECALDIEMLTILKTTFEQHLILPKRQSNVDVLCFMCDICNQILANSKDCWCLPVTQKLMSILFNRCMLPGPIVNESLDLKISSLWHSFIQHLPHWPRDFYEETGFVFEAVTKLHALFISPKSIEMLAPFLEIVQSLFWELEKLLQSENSIDEEFLLHVDKGQLLCDILSAILPSEIEWAEMKKGLQLNILPAFFEKKLFFPLPEDFVVSVPSRSIPPFVLVAELVPAMVVKLFNHANAGTSLSIFRTHFMTQLPQLAWSFSYCEASGYLKKELSEQYVCASKLQRNCFNTFALFSKEEIFQFLKQLYDMCLESSFEWEIPFQNSLEIIQTFYSKDIPDLLKSFLFSEQKNMGNHLIRQVIVHHVTCDTKLSLLNKLSDALDSSGDICLELSTFSELCCCLQDKDVLKSNVVQELVKKILTDLLASERVLEFQTRKDLQESTLIAAFLDCIIESSPQLLSSTMWENIFSYTVLLLEHCLETKEKLCVSSIDLVFAHRTCSFVCILLSTFSEDTERVSFSSRQKASFEQLSEKLLVLFYRLSDICEKMTPVPKTVESFLTTLSQAIEFLPSESLLSGVLQSVALIGSESESPHQNADVDIEFPLQNFLRFLTSSLRPLQLGNHTILMKSMCLLPSLLGTNEEKYESDEQSNDINKRLLPLIELLEYTSQILKCMLSDVKIGECCLVLPNTDSYTYTLAYLFAWSEFLEFIAASTVQERSTYVDYLEKKNLIRSLLSNLFRLMPEKPISCYKNIDKDNLASQEILKIIFAEQPVISLLDPPAVEDIQYVACNTYYNTLKKVPAVVRMWWNNLDKRSAEAVNKFTSKNITMLLASKEIQAVHESDMQFQNMMTRARYATREVIAIYTVDGSTIELSIQLPANYPLGPIVIHDSGNVRISKPEWRQWLKQLTAFLTYQNGSMLDGLLLWKKNLDKKFEGVEECMICFYVLHSTTAKLPQRSCHTCRKKFHTDCIYKWFVTSNTSICPLCRCYF